ASQGAKEIKQSYSLDAVGAKAKARLAELWDRSRPARPLKRNRNTAKLSPALPIQGDWYDEDYFENGVKSNWENGYNWRDFADLFGRTARFLTNSFPEAHSFLDAGCAKGFMVRALRALDKQCTGFDHSPWAIAQADETTRPFLIQASVDNVDVDSQFDMTIAF